jgi:hypothetical protein
MPDNKTQEGYYFDVLKKVYSDRLGATLSPVSNPANAPITKMDKKSTVRMLAAPDDILK